MAQANRTRPAKPLKRASRRPVRGGRNRFGTLLLGLLLGLAVAAAAFLLYPSWQHRPSRLAVDRSREAASERVQPASTPNAGTAASPAPSGGASTTDPGQAPFGISEDVFEAGALLYSSRCASCHGTPAHRAASQPAALQLWQTARSGARRPGKQPPATIYRQIAGGAPTAGMPSYRGVLTATQIWQLSLLLSNAGEDLPDPVLHILDTAR